MIDTIAKNLRAMPYPEMMALAKYLSKELGGGTFSAEYIAEILSRAGTDLGDRKAEEQERKILLQAFTRKRQVNIKKFATGYSIEVPTLPGSCVTGTDLRAMFGQMLDQIVTMELLGGGSTRGR